MTISWLCGTRRAAFRRSDCCPTTLSARGSANYGTLDRDLIREMGQLGFLGVDLPERYGGLGTTSVTTGLIAEELAYGDFNVSAVQVGVSLLGAILAKNAGPEILEPWLRMSVVRRLSPSASPSLVAVRMPRA